MNIKHWKFIQFPLFDRLLREVKWENRDAPRDECFMSDVPLSYTYGKGDHARTYHSMEFHPDVKRIMETLNAHEGSQYNICFLNYYKSEREHLGWHSDDSPEMDPTHPIAVVSFGATRDIWIREKGAKGDVPQEDKYSLVDGSCWIMPAGMQGTHQHKIPKGDRKSGGRISLTFRRYNL